MVDVATRGCAPGGRFWISQPSLDLACRNDLESEFGASKFTTLLQLQWHRILQSASQNLPKLQSDISTFNVTVSQVQVNNEKE